MAKPKLKIVPSPPTEEKSILGDPPAVLRGHALEVWHETVPELKTAGIGQRVEAHALACFCQAVADFHAAQAEIDRLGMIVQTERGFTKNPACTIKYQSYEQILKFSSAFGLTPASRGKVFASPPKASNPFDEFS